MRRKDKFQKMAERLVPQYKQVIVADAMRRLANREYERGHSAGMREGLKIGGNVAIRAMKGSR